MGSLKARVLTSLCGPCCGGVRQAPTPSLDSHFVQGASALYHPNIRLLTRRCCRVRGADLLQDNTSESKPNGCCHSRTLSNAGVLYRSAFLYVCVCIYACMLLATKECPGSACRAGFEGLEGARGLMRRCPSLQHQLRLHRCNPGHAEPAAVNYFRGPERPHKRKDPTFWFEGPRQAGFQKP